jgi:hypothetical protein
MKQRTPFGTMLNNYRYQKQLVIDKLKTAMRKKAGLDNPRYNEEYEFRESQVSAKDGTTHIQVELWKRIDVEHVKISTSVVAEKIEEESKDDEWGI